MSRFDARADAEALVARVRAAVPDVEVGLDENEHGVVRVDLRRGERHAEAILTARGELGVSDLGVEGPPFALCDVEVGTVDEAVRFLVAVLGDGQG